MPCYLKYTRKTYQKEKSPEYSVPQKSSTNQVQLQSTVDNYCSNKQLKHLVKNGNNGKNEQLNEKQRE